VREPRELVDLDRGLVSNEIFADEAIYRLEMERIFARTWLLVRPRSS
jgi:ethylbenzene dioxygenase alpha subunit